MTDQGESVEDRGVGAVGEESTELIVYSEERCELITYNEERSMMIWMILISMDG